MGVTGLLHLLGHSWYQASLLFAIGPRLFELRLELVRVVSGSVHRLDQMLWFHLPRARLYWDLS
jgi:hypothetical protein